jgi:hypothetical protein
VLAAGEVSPEAFSDAEAFEQLRRYAVDAAGPREAPALLYRIGFDRGWADGRFVAEAFGAQGVRAPRLAGPVLPLLFVPGEGRMPDDFGGALHDSIEAAIELKWTGGSDATACHLTAGYASGWFTAILREPILVIEEQCEGQGAAHCRFRGRPHEIWTAAGDPRALDLARYLEPVDPNLDTEPADEAEGMLGGFDPLSPAVHVWGPVMVLPYAGVGDAGAALEAVQADLGEDMVRVVVVDVTGVRLDAAEICGLLELVARLEGRGLDVLIAGVARGDRTLGDSSARLQAPLTVRDLSEGIARAFQIAHSPEGTQ